MPYPYHKPRSLKHISIDDWYNMTQLQQEEAMRGVGVKFGAEATQTAQKLAVTKPQPFKPVFRQVADQVKHTSIDSQEKKYQPEVSETETKEKTQLPTLVGSSLRNWSEPVKGKSGRIIPGSRIQECILFQMDVRKNPWYIMHLSRGFVLSMADKLDADTPEDACLYIGENPLFGLQKISNEEYEIVISKILRKPKDDYERELIRTKFGVTPSTVPFLAKKDCIKCGGSGVYYTSSYPGDPILQRLTESIECDCSYN